MTSPAVEVAEVAVTRLDPPGRPERCSAVAEVLIGDGRRFSILAATPGWFEETFREMGLSYYFGPSVLFVRRMEPSLVREAVAAMAAAGERWLCLHDTPHRTLPEVLADFKARHPR